MCTVQCITTIKYKYYITIGPWSWCDPTRVIFSLLLIVDVPDILSVPFRVTRPGRRLATKTTTTATSQNKSVKVPYRQRTKKVIRRLSTRSYREYSSARSSSLSLSLPLLHHIVVPDWSSMPNDCTAKWFSTVLNVGQSLNCHIKKKEKRSKNQGEMFDRQVPKIATDHPHSVYFSLFFFFFKSFDPFPDRISVSEGATAAMGLPVCLFSADFFRVKGDELSVRDTITRLVYQRITSAMQLVFPTPYSLHSVTQKKAKL